MKYYKNGDVMKVGDYFEYKYRRVVLYYGKILKTTFPNDKNAITVKLLYNKNYGKKYERNYDGFFWCCEKNRVNFKKIEKKDLLTKMMSEVL